jgi:hypothetical protein
MQSKNAYAALSLYLFKNATISIHFGNVPLSSSHINSNEW